MYSCTTTFARRRTSTGPEGAFTSPELRDDAQDARDRLFNLLSEIPGKEAHVALTELVKEHPAPDRRPWMAKRADKRAEQDGDLEPWTAGQVSEFGSALTRTPSTHRQLFDLTLDRLTDLKDWLERGNDSPYRTWRRAGSENEMRILVAGLAQRALGQSLHDCARARTGKQPAHRYLVANPERRISSPDKSSNCSTNAGAGRSSASGCATNLWATICARERSAAV